MRHLPLLQNPRVEQNAGTPFGRSENQSKHTPCMVWDRLGWTSTVWNGVGGPTGGFGTHLPHIYGFWGSKLHVPESSQFSAVFLVQLVGSACLAFW